MAVDPQDGLQEMTDLWSAPTADALHRILVLYPPVRQMDDASEPYSLLIKHHETEPEQTWATAVLLLTDRRWRKGAARLVRRVADGGLLDDEQLDLLARTFLDADEALYWSVPADWFATEAIDVTIADAPGESPVEAQDEDKPVVARRELAPPLRRWAAGHEQARDPAAWTGLLARAQDLNAKHGAAIMAGMLDQSDMLDTDARALLIERATAWPHLTVRQLAFELIADHDGHAAAYALAHDDPNAKIRAWAATLLQDPRAADCESVVPDARRERPDVDLPPTLF